MRLHAILAALLCVLAAPALAAEPTPSPTPESTYEIGGSNDSLSNGKGSWQSAYMSYVWHADARRAIYGTLSSNTRFGNTDPQYTVGIYVPASANTILNVETSLSPTHVVLPSSTVLVSLEHRFALGWGYVLGADHRAYPGLDVVGESLLVDRYWGNFRAAYKISSVQLSNVPGSAFTHTALLAHTYGADGLSQVVLSLYIGRDAENVGPGVLVSAVSGASIGGTHWSARKWALVWSLETTRQGSLYSRSGVQIGIRRRF